MRGAAAASYTGVFSPTEAAVADPALQEYLTHQQHSLTSCQALTAQPDVAVMVSGVVPTARCRKGVPAA